MLEEKIIFTFVSLLLYLLFCFDNFDNEKFIKNKSWNNWTFDNQFVKIGFEN
jgi:hypothetical protein